MSDSYTSSSYYYSSSTNTTDGTTSTGHRYSTTSYTDPDGTTIVRTARQDLGQPAIVEERRFDRTGQEQLLPAPADTATLAGGVKSITDTDASPGTDLDAGVVYGPSSVGAGGGRDEYGDIGRRTYEVVSPASAGLTCGRSL